MVKPEQMLYQLKHGSYFIPNQTWFLFWTFLYFPQITLWKYPCEGLVITEFQHLHLYLSQKNNNTRVRNGLIWCINGLIWCINGLIWCVNANTLCSKIVYDVTAKMSWPISLGRSCSQLFVTTWWRYRAIRSKYMTNKPIYGIGNS